LMGCPNNNCLHTQSLYPEGLPITKGVVVFEIGVFMITDCDFEFSSVLLRP